MSEAPLRAHQNRPDAEDTSFPHTPYRGASLIRTPPLPRATIGPQIYSYCRVLRGGCFS